MALRVQHPLVQGQLLVWREDQPGISAHRAELSSVHATLTGRSSSQAAASSKQQAAGLLVCALVPGAALSGKQQAAGNLLEHFRQEEALHGIVVLHWRVTHVLHASIARLHATVLLNGLKHGPAQPQLW